MTLSILQVTWTLKVTRRSLDGHSTSLGGHSTDTRRHSTDTRRTLDEHSTDTRHSALDTRWDWWCSCKMITANQIVTCVLNMDLLLKVTKNFKAIGDFSHQQKPSVFNSKIKSNSSLSHLLRTSLPNITNCGSLKENFPTTSHGAIKAKMCPCKNECWYLGHI